MTYSPEQAADETAMTLCIISPTGKEYILNQLKIAYLAGQQSGATEIFKMREETIKKDLANV